ncbi:MAG: deoxyribose-phosphate aldolase [Sphaerochaetaceae bacterium]|jgi:deoxyribose-phosphate aldolase|nr:deoxyribose-phosphate aldolase [Sphaerochaetaceae bacterium]NLO61477.1 deoxyribose-phosphate aldolase [Spirochaetales bacterium]MDD2404996.1 deoxyribose-phosphate aldolase [Sphaerochaetaceae bacterium]MDD3671442.1 deoxyribose-phosphate aldolase [Sphaerochaetaceae bacterium]MDD4260273.1 deoxyribose-phosphate aldolase [Sphaerochaetaceae bacterium]
MNEKEAARLIDISAVQAYNNKQDIDELIACAKEYHFYSVHTLPSWTSYLSEQLKDYPDIYVGAPVGFPSGGAQTLIKMQEAKQLITDGARELDMVINIGKLKSGEVRYVEDEIKQVRQLCADLPLKIILETSYLTHDEIKVGCELSINAQADYIKTGTGWTQKGTTIEIIKLIKDFVGSSIKLKASGGIRDYETFKKCMALGVDRFGINTKSAIEIVKKFQ